MAEPAAKKDDKIISNGTKSQVWVKQPPPSTSPPEPVSFKYEGSIDNLCSSNVFVMGKPSATVESAATNSIPPSVQQEVITKGKIQTPNIDNTATITTGSSTVYVNGKKAARNGDKAKTWDYSTPPSPGIPKETENAKIEASGSVFIGG